MLLREDLADLMPMVNEANAISQELDKKVHATWKRCIVMFTGRALCPLTYGVDTSDRDQSHLLGLYVRGMHVPIARYFVPYFYLLFSRFRSKSQSYLLKHEDFPKEDQR